MYHPTAAHELPSPAASACGHAQLAEGTALWFAVRHDMHAQPQPDTVYPGLTPLQVEQSLTRTHLQQQYRSTEYRLLYSVSDLVVQAATAHITLYNHVLSTCGNILVCCDTCAVTCVTARARKVLGSLLRN